MQDECFLGGKACGLYNKKNKINLNFTVVHFQFSGQNSGDKLDKLYLEKYKDLSNNFQKKLISRN